MGRKPQAKIRIREALMDDRLTWTALQNKSGLGKGPLSKNLKDLMTQGEVKYAIDPDLRPAKGYYELNESGKGLANLNGLIKRIENGSYSLPDQTPSLQDSVAESMLVKRFDEAAERYISGLGSSEEVKAWFRENWLEPYEKIFVKVWIEFAFDAVERLKEILAVILVSRSLYNSIPVSFQQSGIEVKEEYERFRQEINKEIKVVSEAFFKSYPEYIEKSVINLIINLNDLILVKEFLKRREKEPKIVQDLINQFRKFLEEKLDKTKGKFGAVDQPVLESYELLRT